MNDTLLDQCLREAEDNYMKPGVKHSTREESFGWLDGYASALYAERSKRPPMISVEEAIRAIVAAKRPNCDDHAPYRGVCSNCGRSDNYMILPTTEEGIRKALTAFYYSTPGQWHTDQPPPLQRVHVVTEGFTDKQGVWRSFDNGEKITVKHWTP